MDASFIISNHVRDCLGSFRSLSDSVGSASQIPGTDDTAESDLATFLALINNELGRFRIWCSNMGAHRRDKASLDYRLRDASPIKNQIVRLLADLHGSLDDAASILRGEVVPWDQCQDGCDEEDSEDDMSTLPPDFEGLTELSQIASEVSDINNCLFGMAISIQHPAPHDRFRHFSNTDTSYFMESDIAHVRNKFPFAWEHVVERLGSANSFRRQYFRYREQHNQKLGHGLGTLDGTDYAQDFDTGVSTIETTASSLPLHMRSFKLSVPGHNAIVDEDTRSEAGLTETSFGFTCAAEGDRPKLPAMPEGAKIGPFECPYCYRIVEAKTPKEWRSHIFSDLRPYICLSLDCQTPNEDYQRRFQWMQHVLENHWKIWKCPKGCKDVIRGVWELRSHIAAFHRDISDPMEIRTLFSLAEHPKPLNAITECELCHEELKSMREYLRHVGRHQEDIALFSLPDRDLEGNCESDNESEESYGDPETDAADETPILDGDNPKSQQESDDEENIMTSLPEAVTQTVAIDAPVGSNITSFAELEFESFDVSDDESKLHKIIDDAVIPELCGDENPELRKRCWVGSRTGMLVWLPAYQRWYSAKVDGQLLAVDRDAALDTDERQARDEEEQIKWRRIAEEDQKEATSKAQILMQEFLNQFQTAMAVDRGIPWAHLEATERGALLQHIHAINSEPVEICSNKEFFELDSRELPAGYVYDPKREEACSSPVLRYLRTWEDRVFADTPIHPYELEAIELLISPQPTHSSAVQQLHVRYGLEHATYMGEVEKSHPFFYHYVASDGGDGMEHAETASAAENLGDSVRGNAFLPRPYRSGKIRWLGRLLRG